MYEQQLQVEDRHHIDQTMLMQNFGDWNEIVERGAVTKSRRGMKSQRGDESGRKLPVEINWAVFERRLM